MKNILQNCTVVIRSTGERTEELCRYAIRQNGISDEQILLVKNVSPFSRALEEGYKMAIVANRKYTFFVDADTVVFSDTLPLMLSISNHLPSSVLFVNALIYDSLSLTINPGGPHLYQTQYLKDALFSIPMKNSYRPETDTVKSMQKDGYDLVFLDFPAALHNFEQYNRDVFKNTMNQYLKSRQLRKRLDVLVEKHPLPNHDFTVAKEAIHYAKNTKLKLTLTKDEFSDAFKDLAIEEKEEIKNIPETYHDLLSTIQRDEIKDLYQIRGYTHNLLKAQKNSAKTFSIRNIIKRAL